jgi:hypothetical protein
MVRRRRQVVFAGGRRTLFHRAANFVASLSTRSHSQGGQELIYRERPMGMSPFLCDLQFVENCKPVRHLETKAESSDLKSHDSVFVFPAETT